jgi:hypothetical protein
VPVASAAAEALVASRRELLQGTVATSPGHASTREQGRAGARSALRAYDLVKMRACMCCAVWYVLSMA